MNIRKDDSVSEAVEKERNLEVLLSAWHFSGAETLRVGDLCSAIGITFNELNAELAHLRSLAARPPLSTADDHERERLR